MNEATMNPFVITVVGLAVVMLTLTALWFLTRLVSWGVALLPATQSERQKILNTAPTSQPSDSQPSDCITEDILVVLTAAATCALGVPVRILHYCEQAQPLSTNGWIHTARVQQMQLPKHNTRKNIANR